MKTVMKTVLRILAIAEIALCIWRYFLFGERAVGYRRMSGASRWKSRGENTSDKSKNVRM